MKTIKINNEVKILLLTIFMCSLVACGNNGGVSDKISITPGSLVAKKKLLWGKGKVLNVSFLDGDTDLKAEVERHAKEWSLYGNIDFKFYANLRDLPNNVSVDILISFAGGDNGQSFSNIGTNSKYSAQDGSASITLSLSRENIFSRRRHILHEFGHALGLDHEHQNPRRLFHFNPSIQNELCNGFTEESCKRNITGTLEEENLYASEYDSSSIMHYAFHVKQTLEKINIGGAVSLSLRDKIEIAKLYPGRSSEDEIIASHKRELQNMILFLNAGKSKNCTIIREENEEMRFDENQAIVKMKVNYYHLKSIKPGEFNTSKTDSAEAAYKEIFYGYCGMESDKLAEYRSKNADAINRIATVVGNCSINRDEDGELLHPGCPEGFDYTFGIQGKGKNLSSLCFEQLEQTIEAMKNEKRCFEENRVEISNKASEDGFSSLCQAIDARILKKGKKQICPNSSPWFLARNSNVPINSGCYISKSEAEKMSKNYEDCQ